MEQYNVTGMSCAACSARVEKAVLKVPGVESCAVSLLTNSMGVSGSASSEEIIAAVSNAGYGASLKVTANRIGGSSDSGNSSEEDYLKDKDTPVIKKRLIYSLVFLAILMYFSMGHSMFGWRVPSFLEGNYIALGLTQLILTVVIMIINQKFFVSGFKGAVHGAPNMDTLVALGASAAFIYSTYSLFAMTAYNMVNDFEAVKHLAHEFYFESTAMILTLITLGKMLEARSKGKTTDAIKGLMKIAPKKATVIRNNEEIVVSIDQVVMDDIFVVKPGETIPVDGLVMDGISAVDESSLTGESIPVDKSEGSNISAGTINQYGVLKCRAIRVGSDTTLSKIIQMVSDAAATKAPIAKIADKVSGVFVPVVIGIAVVTIIIWLLVGESVGFALARGISVLVISCPCALGLATPVAIMVGNGKGARNGILFKTATSLENAGKIDIVALDKTGTITEGVPKVTDIMTEKGVSENELLSFAYDLEKGSEHPLAKAVVEEAEARNISLNNVSEFKIIPGKGIYAEQDNRKMYGGNYDYINSIISLDNSLKTSLENISKEGKTPLLFCDSSKYLGAIAVADTIKEDSKMAIEELKNMGISVVMITGDNKYTANTIAKQAGVDDVISGVLPDGKEKAVSNLMEKGKVLMVGDGINDAPALTKADIGMAIGAGTDIAIDAADVVLMNSNLSDVPAAIKLSKATLRIIHQNLFWAFIYNVLGIPLAAGVFISSLGLKLSPMFGALAMSLSSFFVVSNALRLNVVDIRRGNKKINDKKNNDKQEKESKKMNKTMVIEGMMCGHCEARVKKVLEALPEVDEAVVSHEKGTAVLTLNQSISDEKLKSTVEEHDYKVVSVE